MQQITKITRPNIRGGSCIDLIMANSLYVLVSGISNDMVSDHYTVFCVKKKKKDERNVVLETVRDYKKFNKDLFSQILSNLDWAMFDNDLNPNTQWEWLLAKVLDILSVMCPYKKVHTRTPRKEWLTPDIYTLIRERKRMLKNYQASLDPNLFCQLRILRNKIYASIDKAKMNYVKNVLKATRKDPKRFWRNLKSIIEGHDCCDSNISFKDPDTGLDIPKLLPKTV